VEEALVVLLMLVRLRLHPLMNIQCMLMQLRLCLVVLTDKKIPDGKEHRGF
jgi:hypothetical protein